MSGRAWSVGRTAEVAGFARAAARRRDEGLRLLVLVDGTCPRWVIEATKGALLPERSSAEVIVTDRNGREIDVTVGRNNTYTFTQPRGRVTIEVTFVREGSGTFFTDVPDTYWAYNEIRWAYDNGYVNGTSASTFSPGASISRQQVWMILALALIVIQLVHNHEFLYQR